MRVIHKYLFEGSPISMPVGAEIVSVGDQGPNLCIWAKVNSIGTATEKRDFKLLATGEDLMGYTKHIYTSIGETYVLHLMESETVFHAIP